MAIDHVSWEIVRCDGPDERLVELWDRTLTPGGLALEVVESAGDDLTLTGHGVKVPLDVVTEFLGLARAYFTARANDP